MVGRVVGFINFDLVRVWEMRLQLRLSRTPFLAVHYEDSDLSYIRIWKRAYQKGAVSLCVTVACTLKNELTQSLSSLLTTSMAV